MELEITLLNNKGQVVNKAPEIINAVKKKHPEIDIYHEVGLNFFEIGCFPTVETYSPAYEIINALEDIMEVAKKQDCKLYPFGSYPGTFQKKITPTEGYRIKGKILGKENLLKALNTAGFHCHYSLPRSVFDAKTKFLKIMHNSKLSASMIGSYNCCIAADPVLALFSQSSPWSDGISRGKNMRAINYRGGKKLSTTQSVYSKFQQFGGLPPYKQTLHDLLYSMKRRTIRWYKLIKSVDPKADPKAIYPFPLDISWNPVKINKHGTIEQRGMDANLPSINLANMVLFKYTLRVIQRNFLTVTPTDFGIENAFKIEDGKLYIPPHTIVRSRLQRASVYKGYEDDTLYNYAKRFYRFAKSQTPKRYQILLKPIDEMIDSKKSTSDRMIDVARRKGFTNGSTDLNNTQASELALHFSDKLNADIKLVRKNLSKLVAL